MTQTVIEVDRSCLNCRWLRRKERHLGCYYNYDWRMWLPGKDVELFPLCETGKFMQLKDCHWEKK